MPWRYWPTRLGRSSAATCPGCRRFKAEPPACSATIWAAAWNRCPPRLRRVPRAGPGRRTLRRGGGLRPRGRPGVDHLAGFARDRTRAAAPPRGASGLPSAAAGSTIAPRSPAQRDVATADASGIAAALRRSIPSPGPPDLTSNFSARRLSCTPCSGRSTTSTPATCFR